MAEIMTIRGLMDEADLTHSQLIIDNENEYTVRDEWRTADGELVRNDVHVRLKQALPIALLQEEIG